MSNETARTTTETIAAEAAAAFTTTTRGEERERITVLRDGAPDWIAEAVYAAHSGLIDLLPDDWRYACIAAAFEHIAEGGDEDAHEFADAYVDVYTSARLEWLSSNLGRSAYVEEAVSEGLAGDTQDPAELAGIGQYMEAAEVYAAVWRAVEERAGDVEDETP